MPARSRTDIATDPASTAVSVIVPAFNAADTIAETISSLFAQTHTAWEAVVVDDGSTDSTAAIVAEFAQRDARIRLVSQPNAGEAGARNAAIREALNPWLLFLDADDWIAPTHLEKMTRVLAADPSLDAVHCGWARVALDGTLLVEEYRPPAGDMFAVWAKRSAFPVHACVVRKALVDTVGGFDESLVKSADWDLWQRVARTGAQFGAVREVLSYYRMRPQAASLEAGQMLADGLLVLTRGHAVDPRVAHPHPDHALGAPPEEIPHQAFYLLSWCAGLEIGRNVDARPLLARISGLRFPGLYPEAVAQCLFDATPLPSCQSPAAWQDLWPRAQPLIDYFLVALESHAAAPALADRARRALMTMCLRHAPAWTGLVEAIDAERLEHADAVARMQKELVTEHERLEELERARDELQAALSQQVAAQRDLDRELVLVEERRADWERIAGQQGEVAAGRAMQIVEMERIGALLRDEIANSERLLRERGELLADLRAQRWTRLGFALGIVLPPGQVAGSRSAITLGRDGTWDLAVRAPNAARLDAVPGERDGARIVITTVRRGDRWDIQLNWPGLRLTAGVRYTVHFRARADRSRIMGMGVAEAQAPWTNLGLYRLLRLSPHWHEFTSEFTATADAENARVHFDVGRNQSAVEIAAVGISDLQEQDAGVQPGSAVHERSAAVEPPRTADSVPAMLAGPAPAGRLKRIIIPPGSPALSGMSPLTLSGEVIARIEQGAFSTSEEGILLGCELRDALDGALDVHNNRWSARRYRDLFGDFYGSLGEDRPSIDGATIVDLGCGSHNPFGVLFLFLMLGAQRGIAIDLDEIQDLPRAARALADLAGMLLVNPGEILGDYEVDRGQMLRNIESFDLVKLQAGDPTGIDMSRLSYRRESVHALTLDDAEADVVISNSFFEHIPGVDGAIAQIARITRAGGVGIHMIDGSDHRRYDDPSYHPLEFLTESSNAPIVHGSNRVRPKTFGSLFAQHGFDEMSFVSFVPGDAPSLPPGMRSRMKEPFRSMPEDVLAAYMGKLMVRRK